MGRCDGLEFIWERVPQTTSFKFDRSLPQGTMCLFKMKVLSIERVLYTLEGSRSMHGSHRVVAWRFVVASTTWRVTCAQLMMTSLNVESSAAIV